MKVLALVDPWKLTDDAEPSFKDCNFTKSIKFPKYFLQDLPTSITAVTDIDKQSNLS